MRYTYQRYRQFRPFTDAEAWLLFKLAAYFEAVGWTLLIIGVACRQLPVSWNQIPVLLAGRTHGVLFLMYVVAAFVLAPSLGWSFTRTLFAGACSVPPYGTLLFEKYIAYTRWYSQSRTFYRTILYAANAGL